MLLGVTGSGKTFTMAKVIEGTQRPALILAPNKTLAAQLYGEFKNFFPDNAVEYFVSYYDYYQPEAYVPRTDTYIEKEASINEQIDRMRHAATRSLLERDDVIIVASVSCIYGIGSVETYTAMTFTVQVGERLSRDQLLADLVALHYRRNDADFQRGTFRVRGDTVELFPAHLEDRAWRISLFGDEIESIVEFDPLTGQKTDDLALVKIYANSHYVTPKPTLQQAIKSIKARAEAAARRALRRRQAAGSPAPRAAHHLRHGDDGGDGLLRRHRELLALSDRAASPGEPPPTLFEYLPDNALVFVDESHVTVPQIGGMFRGDYRRKATLAEYGFRLPSCMDNRPLRFEEWDAMRPQTAVRVGDARRLGARADRRRLRRAGHPPHRPHRSAGAWCARPRRRSTTCSTRSGRSRQERLPHAGHDADQAHGRGPDRVHARGRHPRALHALRHRDAGAHRDHPRPAPRRLRRADRHQPLARRPRHPRVRARRHPRRRQGRLPALRDLADADHRPRRAQRRRQVILYADQRDRARWSAPSPRPTAGARSSSPRTTANGITPESIKRNIHDVHGSVYEQDHVTVDAGLADDADVVGHNLAAVIEDMERRMHDGGRRSRVRDGGAAARRDQAAARDRARHRRRSAGAAVGSRGQGRRLQRRAQVRSERQPARRERRIAHQDRIRAGAADPRAIDLRASRSRLSTTWGLAPTALYRSATRTAYRRARRTSIRAPRPALSARPSAGRTSRRSTRWAHTRCCR